MIAAVSLGDNLDLGVARLFKRSYSGYGVNVGLNPWISTSIRHLCQWPGSPLWQPTPPEPSLA